MLFLSDHMMFLCFIRTSYGCSERVVLSGCKTVISLESVKVIDVFISDKINLIVIVYKVISTVIFDATHNLQPSTCRDDNGGVFDLL